MKFNRHIILVEEAKIELMIQIFNFSFNIQEADKEPKAGTAIKKLEQAGEDYDEDDEVGSVLFVKNLNFNTNDDSLKEVSEWLYISRTCILAVVNGSTFLELVYQEW